MLVGVSHTQVELASRTLHDDLSRLGVDPSNSSVFVTTDSAEVGVVGCRVWLPLSLPSVRVLTAARSCGPPQALTEFQSKIGDRLLFIPGDPMHLDRSDPAVAAEGAVSCLRSLAFALLAMALTTRLHSRSSRWLPITTCWALARPS